VRGNLDKFQFVAVELGQDAVGPLQVVDSHLVVGPHPVERGADDA
jgi:hypothetical protein